MSIDRYKQAIDDIYNSGPIGRALVLRYFGALHDQPRHVLVASCATWADHECNLRGFGQGGEDAGK